MSREDNLRIIEAQIIFRKKQISLLQPIVDRNGSFSREEKLEFIDAQIALHEELLRVLMEEVDRSWRNKFTVMVAQDLYLRTKYPDCKTCEKQMIAEACLEARKKTGKCIFEVDYEQLQKLPWPAKGEEGL